MGLGRSPSGPSPCCDPCCCRGLGPRWKALGSLNLLRCRFSSSAGQQGQGGVSTWQELILSMHGKRSPLYTRAHTLTGDNLAADQYEAGCSTPAYLLLPLRLQGGSPAHHLKAALGPPPNPHAPHLRATRKNAREGSGKFTAMAARMACAQEHPRSDTADLTHVANTVDLTHVRGFHALHQSQNTVPHQALSLHVTSCGGCLHR